MGIHPNVGYDVFPVQGERLGEKAEVIRDGQTVTGQIVRDDLIDPLVTMIELEDGSVVLSDEQDGYIKVEQGNHKDRPTKVCFNYDTSHILEGTVVRDDMEEPFRTVIKLDVGRFVLSSECMYSPR